LSRLTALSLTPVWLEWCEQQRSKKGQKHFSASEDTSLVCIEDGVLNLACQNTTTATTLKHQQNDLLTHLQSAGFETIHRIRIKMDLTASRSSESNLVNQTTNQTQSPRATPSDSSIKSVESVQRRIKNEHLAASLKRLANTLKNHN